MEQNLKEFGQNLLLLTDFAFCGGVHFKREVLEKDGGGRDLVLALGEMSYVWQVETHDPAVRLYHPFEDSPVGGGAAVGLHVDSPLALQLVHVLIASVVPLAGLALTVLVVEAGPHAVQDGQGGVVLALHHLQVLLALLLVQEHRDETTS